MSMLTNTAAAAARTLKLLALAASGLGFWHLCDDYGLNPTCIVPWTNEKIPGAMYTPRKRVPLADGSTLAVWEGPEGIWIERYASEAQDEILLAHGFWRDCELQEAAWFAREAWGC